MSQTGNDGRVVITPNYLWMKSAAEIAPFTTSGSCEPVPIGGPVPLRVKVLPHGEGLPLPSYGSEGAAALDLRAASPEGVAGGVTLPPGSAHKIPTGLSVAIPAGFAGLVLSRSGLAAKYRVAVTNSPGLVDSDYRGEIFILLENRGSDPFYYNRGDRLAQLLLVPVPKVQVAVVADLDDTDRGSGGLGSTGVA